MTAPRARATMPAMEDGFWAPHKTLEDMTGPGGEALCVRVRQVRNLQARDEETASPWNQRRLPASSMNRSWAAAWITPTGCKGARLLA